MIIEAVGGLGARVTEHPLSRAEVNASRPEQRRVRVTQVVEADRLRDRRDPELHPARGALALGSVGVDPGEHGRGAALGPRASRTAPPAGVAVALHHPSVRCRAPQLIHEHPPDALIEQLARLAREQEMVRRREHRGAQVRPQLGDDRHAPRLVVLRVRRRPGPPYGEHPPFLVDVVLVCPEHLARPGRRVHACRRRPPPRRSDPRLREGGEHGRDLASA